MMKVSCLVFITFTLVLSHQDVSKRGGVGSKRGLQEVTIKSTNQALAYLIKAGKPILSDEMSYFHCGKDMIERCNPENEGLFCNFGEASCYVIGTVAKKEVKLYPKNPHGFSVPSGSDQCRSRPEFQAIILPFLPDGDTYTFLNPSVAPWFFTASLGGCDMFVATETNHGATPLVIHSNRNTIDNTVDNLRAKEQFVDRLLKKLGGTYRVIARVHWTSPDDKAKGAIDKHLENYVASHPEVRLIPYNEKMPSGGKQRFQFIGHYRRKFFTWPPLQRRWQFINKGEKNGAISEFSVSPAGNVI